MLGSGAVPAEPGEELPHSPDQETEKFPIGVAFSVWIVQLYNGIQYALVFTMAVYVVRRFEGPGASEERIGQLAGLLAATSSFAVGLAAWPWGLASDRIGRKLVILIGNCSTATCILLFSLAKNYELALLSRLLAGMFDGSLVMTKVMVGETCTPTMQGRVMGYLALGDAMGNIIGPALGGALSDPCSRFSMLQGTSACREAGLLAEHPFLLPCAVTAFLGFLTNTINVFTMEETLPRLRTRAGAGYLPLKPREPIDEEAAQPFPEKKLAALPTLPEARETSWSSADSSPPQHLDSGDSSQVLGAAIEMQKIQSLHSGRSLHDSVASTDDLLAKYQSGTCSVADSELEEEEARLLERKQPAEPKLDDQDPKWWRSRPLQLTLVVTAWMLSIAKYTDELGPIFVSAPVEQGGLGLPLDAFALPLALAGIVLTLFSVFGYPQMQAVVGVKAMCSIGLLAAIPGVLILPTTAFLRSMPLLEKVTLFVAITITKLTTQTSFTASMIAINSLGRDFPGALGSINGVRMTMAALGRALGPIICGFLWGFSTTLTFPLHHYLGFLVPSVALIGCWYLHHRIPMSFEGA